MSTIILSEETICTIKSRSKFRIGRGFFCSKPVYILLYAEVVDQKLRKMGIFTQISF